MAHLESDNAVLTEGFHWAAEKTRQFVMTGKTGPTSPPIGRGTTTAPPFTSGTLSTRPLAPS